MNKTLEQLETSTIKKLLKALEVSFPKELSLEDFYSEGQTTVFTPWTIPEIGLSNKSSQSKTQLEQYVETITDTKSVRQAYATLFEIYEKRVATKTTEAPKGEEKTTLRSDESEELIQKAEAQQTKVKETRAKAEQDVQNAIKTKIEQAKANAKAVEGKKVFIKVEVEQKGVPILTVEETKIISNYAEEVKKDPKEVQAELENIITDRVTQTLKKQGLSDEEIKLAIKQTAVTLVSNLSNINDPDRIPENEQIAIYGAISGSPSVIPEAREAAGNVATHSYYSSLSHQHITQTAFGPQFANNIFGLSPELYKVIVSQKPISQDSEKDQPQQEVFEVDLQLLHDTSIKILETQDGIIERVKDLAQDEARTVILNQTGTFINNQISKIPATSTAGKIVKSPELRSIFYSKFGVGTPVNWEARNEFAQTVLKYSPESAPYISAVGKIFGIQTGIYTATNVIPLSFGQGIVVSKIAFIQPIKVLPAPFTMAIKTGTKVAVGAGAGAAGAGATGAVAGKAAGGIISKITAFFGSAGGPVGTVVGFVAGTLIGKVIEKIDWAKAKKFFREWGMPVVVGGALFLAGRPFMGLVAGTGIHLAARGVTLAAVGYGVWRFFGIIGASIGVAIATPVIVTLLILPPLVAFIMLVINNSAYVVPPSPLSGTSENPYIDVLKTVEPSGPFENSDLPITVTYTVTVSAKRDTLTNITFNDICRIIQENANGSCSNTTHTPPSAIAPGSAYVLTYTNTYSVFTTDALIVNTFEVSADAGEGGRQTVAGVASIIIGDPPTSCINFEGDWPNDKKALVENAIAKIRSEYPGYLAKICEEYSNGLPFRYNRSGSGEYWGNWSKGVVTLYPDGLGNQNDAIYIVSHELLHVLVSGRYFSIYRQYENIPSIFSETPRCFYKYLSSLKEERLAEAVAFTIMPNRSCSITGQTSNINNWPRHRDFVQQYIIR